MFCLKMGHILFRNGQNGLEKLSYLVYYAEKELLEIEFKNVNSMRLFELGGIKMSALKMLSNAFFITTLSMAAYLAADELKSYSTFVTVANGTNSEQATLENSGEGTDGTDRRAGPRLQVVASKQ